MTIPTKKMSSFRFKETDLDKWKKKAKRLKITLTEYIEKKVNNDNQDPHLFV